MAKIVEESVTIKLSVLVPNDSPDPESNINDELLQTLETVAQELVPAGVVIEVEGE